MTDDDSPFGTALHDRVRDEHPDLDQLIRVSTRAGTRLRRRRTAGAAVGGVLGVAALAGIVGASLGGDGGTPGSDPGVATQPAASMSASASTRADELNEVIRPQDLPVRLDPRSLGGWQVGAAADDKIPATNGKYFVSVNVRPLSEYDAWSGNDPDRPASQVVHTGDNYFVTIQPAPGMPEAILDELVGALRFEPRWQQ